MKLSSDESLGLSNYYPEIGEDKAIPLIKLQNKSNIKSILL